MTEVSLRLIRSEDAPRLAALLTASREHMAPWEPDRPPEYFTADGQLAVVQRDLAQQAEDRGWPAVICLNGEVVGRITLFGFIRGPLQTAVVGYWVSGGHIRRGVASRALELALQVAFTDLSLHRLEAQVQVQNVASQGVLRRNGFRRVGLLERHFLAGGQWHDDFLYERVAASSATAAADAGRIPRTSR